MMTADLDGQVRVRDLAEQLERTQVALLNLSFKKRAASHFGQVFIDEDDHMIQHHGIPKYEARPFVIALHISRQSV